MKVRLTVGVLIAALAVYFVLLTGRALALLQTGELVGILLGVGVLILPLLGVWLVYSNLRFGWETEKMARELDADGLLPDVSHLPRRPSGRVVEIQSTEWGSATPIGSRRGSPSDVNRSPLSRRTDPT